MTYFFSFERELNVLSRKCLAPCISHIKLCAVGASSGVKYGCQLHRNMQMWAYTVEGREGGRWWWFISRVFQLVLVDVNCSLSIFHLQPSLLLFSLCISFLCFLLLLSILFPQTGSIFMTNLNLLVDPPHKGLMWVLVTYWFFTLKLNRQS